MTRTSLLAALLLAVPPVSAQDCADADPLKLIRPNTASRLATAEDGSGRVGKSLDSVYQLVEVGRPAPRVAEVCVTEGLSRTLGQASPPVGTTLFFIDDAEGDPDSTPLYELGRWFSEARLDGGDLVLERAPTVPNGLWTSLQQDVEAGRVEPTVDLGLVADDLPVTFGEDEATVALPDGVAANFEGAEVGVPVTWSGDGVGDGALAPPLQLRGAPPPEPPPTPPPPSIWGKVLDLFVYLFAAIGVLAAVRVLYRSRGKMPNDGGKTSASSEPLDGNGTPTRQAWDLKWLRFHKRDASAITLEATHPLIDISMHGVGPSYPPPPVRPPHTPRQPSVEDLEYRAAILNSIGTTIVNNRPQLIDIQSRGGRITFEQIISELDIVFTELSRAEQENNSLKIKLNRLERDIKNPNYKSGDIDHITELMDRRFGDLVDRLELIEIALSIRSDGDPDEEADSDAGNRSGSSPDTVPEDRPTTRNAVAASTGEPSVKQSDATQRSSAGDADLATGGRSAIGSDLTPNPPSAGVGTDSGAPTTKQDSTTEDRLGLDPAGHKEGYSQRASPDEVAARLESEGDHSNIASLWRAVRDDNEAPTALRSRLREPLERFLVTTAGLDRPSLAEWKEDVARILQRSWTPEHGRALDALAESGGWRVIDDVKASKDFEPVQIDNLTPGEGQLVERTDGRGPVVLAPEVALKPRGGGRKKVLDGRVYRPAQ